MRMNNRNHFLLVGFVLLLLNVNCFAASAMVQQQRLQELNQTNAKTQQVINYAQQQQQQQQQQLQQTLQQISSSNSAVSINAQQPVTPPPQSNLTINQQPQQPADNANQAPPDITGFAKPSDTQQNQNSNWNYGF